MKLPSHLRSSAFGSLVLVLLLAILLTQLQILARMPPTFGDLRAAASREERAAILARVPLVRVQSGQLEVDVVNTPVVTITNEPLDVYIVR